LIFAICISWIILLILKNQNLIAKNYSIVIFLCGNILYGIGIIAISYSRTIDFSNITNYIISPYINSVIWSLILIETIYSTADLEKLFYRYAIFRILEIGVVGLIIYFLNKPEIYAYMYNINDMAYLNMKNPRLGSFSVPESIKASLYLIFANAILVYRLYNKIKIIDIILMGIGLIAILFTWSRSGWIFQVIVILLFFFLVGKLKFRHVFLFSIVILASFFLLQDTINSRLDADARLTSSQNYNTRVFLLQEYASNIQNIPIFGVIEKAETMTKILDVNTSISSENIILDAFTTRGIFGGLLTIFLFAYFLRKFIKIRRESQYIYRAYHSQYLFITMITCIYISLFLLANTFLFLHTEPIWWLLFASVAIIEKTPTEY
jgi:O-antigen ligase